MGTWGGGGQVCSRGQWLREDRTAKSRCDPTRFRPRRCPAQGPIARPWRDFRQPRVGARVVRSPRDRSRLLEIKHPDIGGAALILHEGDSRPIRGPRTACLDHRLRRECSRIRPIGSHQPQIEVPRAVGGEEDLRAVGGPARRGVSAQARRGARAPPPAPLTPMSVR